ncbi:MAG: hypothetical protein Q8S54_11675 [Bacteroidota bacterium]|nr:hypothetical protein [Bacteroidota bacterium]
MPDLTALIEAAHQIIYAPSVQYQDVFFWNVYKVNEDKIIVIPEAVEQAKSHFRAYAETSEEIEKLRKVKNLCRTLDSFLIHGCDPDKLNISNVCYFDRFSNRFEPSSQFIKFSI